MTEFVSITPELVVVKTKTLWRVRCAVCSPAVSGADMLLPSEASAESWREHHEMQPEHVFWARDSAVQERWQWWQGRWYHLRPDGTWELDVPEADVPDYIRQMPRGDPGTY